MHIADNLTIAREDKMGIWMVAPIADEAEIVLVSWTIFEVTSKLCPDKTRHFVGYSANGREGRVSSPIVRFDRVNMVGKTRSGRIYQLQGPQSTGSLDGLHVWEYWCKRNEITDVVILNFDLLSHQ